MPPCGAHARAARTTKRLQAGEQRRLLASKDKEASAMRKQLDDARAKMEACRVKMQVRVCVCARARVCVCFWSAGQCSHANIGWRTGDPRHR
jgi:hypothetical protein